MLMIPKSWLPLATADYPAETLGCLGASVAGIPPVVAGILPMIELAGARWFIDPTRREPKEAARALYLIAKREEAIPAVVAYEKGDTGRLDRLAAAWIARHPEVTASLSEIVRLVILPVSSGFGLLPQGGGESGEWWFGSEWLGSIVGIGCELGLGGYHDLTWRVPLALVGHAVAAHVRRQGTKGVGRKLDEAAVDREIAAAQEREKRGELHPWQIAAPESYSPSEEQIKARPAIMADYERLLAEREKNA